jgi:hypothetical protein
VGQQPVQPIPARSTHTFDPQTQLKDKRYQQERYDDEGDYSQHSSHDAHFDAPGSLENGLRD